MRYFLLVYDRVQGKILSELNYPVGEATRALADRSALLAAQTDPNVEVVLLGADSYDDLEKTHGRYFQTPLEAATAR